MAVLAGLVWVHGGAAASAEVVVRLELSQQFYYAGDSLSIRVSVGNGGDKKVDNPIQVPLFGGFRVRGANAALESAGSSTAEEPARPGKLAPRSFYGGVIDLVDLYPQLAETGRYEIYWSGSGIVSDMLQVTVIPRFDPTANYTGKIRTDQGTIVVDFYERESPIAVKSFIDLANAGFYDGLRVHEVVNDSYIVGGDPRHGTPPKRAISYPAEQSNLPLVAGTVVMQPVSAAPPANGPAFVIVLRPRPAWTGQVTVVGQVVRGLDIVRDISRVPSTMKNSSPNFRPLQDVLIQGVTIEKKGSASGPS